MGGFGFGPVCSQVAAGLRRPYIMANRFGAQPNLPQLPCGALTGRSQESFSNAFLTLTLFPSAMPAELNRNFALARASLDSVTSAWLPHGIDRTATQAARFA